MSEDILLRIIAQDQYSAEMKEAKASIDKMTDAEKKAATAAKEHGDQLQKMGNIAKGAALAGVAAVTAAVVDSIKETMEYTKSIRDLAQNLAITTEETSRIIQTADDFTVSQEAVTAALQMSVKKGMQPNIETLAKMADEYNAIADPTERAARLTEVFGRGWTALTPMLKEGGQAIRDAAASQSDALIVTEEQSKAVRELEVSMDNLGDKVTALKLKVGNALIPVINEASDAFGYLTEGIGTTDAEEARLTKEIANNVFWLGENSDATKNASRALQEYLIKKQNAISMTDASDRAIQRETATLLSTSKANAANAEGLKAYYTAMRDSINAQAEYKTGTDALILSTQALTKETLLKIATEGMDATAALSIAKSMGMVDEKVASQIERLRSLKDQHELGTLSTEKYIRAIQDLRIELGQLPDMKRITVEVNYQTGGRSGRVGGEVDLNAGVDNLINKGLIP